MELSVLAAKILCLTYICAGIAALSGKIAYPQMAEEFQRSPALTFVTGFFTLAMGVILVEYHNVWTKDWRTLITIVSWMTLLKGMALIAFPQFVFTLKSRYHNTRAWGIVMMVLGIIFGYFGFIH